eukprot:GHVO01049419.1.p1 GENE.GHVO01049419.1~~GHVO01049419.1.p1  ORF type:complete len:276 (+),score=15.76 GHVO01049419.1:38-865(+)
MPQEEREEYSCPPPVSAAVGLLFGRTFSQGGDDEMEFAGGQEGGVSVAFSTPKELPRGRPAKPRWGSQRRGCSGSRRRGPRERLSSSRHELPRDSNTTLKRVASGLVVVALGLMVYAIYQSYTPANDDMVNTDPVLPQAAVPPTTAVDTAFAGTSATAAATAPVSDQATTVDLCPSGNDSTVQESTNNATVPSSAVDTAIGSAAPANDVTVTKSPDLGATGPVNTVKDTTSIATAPYQTRQRRPPAPTRYFSNSKQYFPNEGGWCIQSIECLVYD